jgi:hypothetical protein
MNAEHLRETEVLGESPPVPLCPSQIPHGLIWDRARTAALGGWLLTSRAMARPRIVPQGRSPLGLRVLFKSQSC